MYFDMKMDWFIPFIYLMKILKTAWIYCWKQIKISHSMSILKNFNRFMCNKTKCKNGKHFCRYWLQCFSSERVLVEHKKVCWKTNGKQTVKLRSGSIKFKYYFKQLAAPFRIYADFECNVKRVKSGDRGDSSVNNSCTKKNQEHIPCSFAYKVVCVDDKFSKPVVL